MDNDFGFTAVDDPAAGLPQIPTVDQVVTPEDISSIKLDLFKVLNTLDTISGALAPKLSALQVDERLKAVEDLVLPLLNNLAKNPEKDYLLWPNRQEPIKKLKDQLLSLTRPNPTN